MLKKNCLVILILNSRNTRSNEDSNYITILLYLQLADNLRYGFTPPPVPRTGQNNFVAIILNKTKITINFMFEDSLVDSYNLQTELQFKMTEKNMVLFGTLWKRTLTISVNWLGCVHA